jgi:hypothetical protein
MRQCSCCRRLSLTGEGGGNSLGALAAGGGDGLSRSAGKGAGGATLGLSLSLGLQQAEQARVSLRHC